MREPKEVLSLHWELPQPILLLHNAFQRAGQKLYVVGGAVRDKVQNKTPHDHDLATACHPDEVVKILNSTYKGKVREVGKSFGVVLVTFDTEHEYEIATFRTDAKTGDGRRPDYVTFSTLEEDADRRDLTINALYYDVAAGQVLDFHGGLQDLRQGVVRFVGDPAARLEEDKLRALRFVRFHCRVNPGSNMDQQAVEAIQMMLLRPEISEERIRDEFLKGWEQAIEPKNFLSCLEQVGLLKQLYPKLLVRSDIWFSQQNIPAVAIAQMLRDNQPSVVHDVLMAGKYTVDEARDVQFLVGLGNWQMQHFVDFRKGLKRTTLHPELVRKYACKLHLSNADLIEQMVQAPYPTVDSALLMEQGFEGPALGKEINRLETARFLDFVRKVAR